MTLVKVTPGWTGVSVARRRSILARAVAVSPPTSAASASSRRISHPLASRTGAVVAVYFASGQKGTNPPNRATAASPLSPVESHFTRGSRVAR